MTQLEQLQRLLDELVAAGAPGAAAWVQDEDGSLQAAGGVADISTGRPMEARLRFRAGSLTKPLVATVVLQLVAEGRLSLTDTLEQRLPGILPYGDRVSIRQLLNHTSGVPHDWATIERTLYGSPTGTPPRLDPAGASRPGGRPTTRLPAGRGLVVLQHRLHPARAGRGGGWRQDPRAGASPADPRAARAVRHLPPRRRQRASEPDGARLQPSSRPAGRGAGRPTAGLHGPEPLVGLGGGWAGVRPAGPDRLLPGAAGRPAAVVGAAGRDAA